MNKNSLPKSFGNYGGERGDVETGDMLELVCFPEIQNLSSLYCPASKVQLISNYSQDQSQVKVIGD